MLTPKDVDNLAELSRLALLEDEKAGLLKDLESILGYVSELQKAPGDEIDGAAGHLARNVLREDGEPHESGKHTEGILKQAPQREGEYVKVKQILGGSDNA